MTEQLLPTSNQNAALQPVTRSSDELGNSDAFHLTKPKFWIGISIMGVLAASTIVFIVLYVVLNSDYNSATNTNTSLLAAITELKTEISHLNADIKTNNDTLTAANTNLKYIIAEVSAVSGQLKQALDDIKIAESETALTETQITTAQKSTNTFMCYHKFYYTNGKTDGNMTRIVRTLDNGYITLYREDGAQVTMTKLNIQGTPVWTKAIEYNSDAEILVQQANGNFIIVLSNETGSMVRIYTSNGTQKAGKDDYACRVVGVLDSNPDVIVACLKAATNTRVTKMLCDDNNLDIDVQVDNFVVSTYHTSLIMYNTTTTTQIVTAGAYQATSPEADRDDFTNGDLLVYHIDENGTKAEYSCTGCKYAEAMIASPTNPKVLILSVCTTTTAMLTIVEYDPSSYTFDKKLAIEAIDVTNFKYGSSYMINVDTNKFAITVGISTYKVFMIYDYSADTVTTPVKTNDYDPYSYDVVNGNNGQIAVLTNDLNVFYANGTLNTQLHINDNVVEDRAVADLFDTGYIVNYGDSTFKVYQNQAVNFSSSCTTS